MGLWVYGYLKIFIDWIVLTATALVVRNYPQTQRPEHP